MWSHKKFKLKEFVGNYEYDKKGIRVLYLERFNSKGKKVESFKFSSWEAAKKLGWVKG